MSSEGFPRATAYLQCMETNCQATYDAGERIYTCEQCGGLLDVQYEWQRARLFDVLETFDARRASFHPHDISGVWRFRELLPFVTSPTQIVTLGEGNTPVWDVPRSAGYAGLKRLAVKHQGLNPTGSFKDNGMTTGMAQARRLGARAVACASTGNTSASLAAYAARAGVHGIVFIPGGRIAYGKLAQSLDYGAVTLQIEGNFDDAMRLVRELARTTPLYLLNSVNPFRLEGQKTIAFELLQQRRWRVPDWVVVPGGNLGNVSALGKGFKELHDLGLIARLPRLAVIQAEGAAPLAQWYAAGQTGNLAPVARPKTLATAIQIGNPVSWWKAVRALEWTNGVCAAVSEQEIADAKAMLGRDGIGCEPASAATVAGLRRLVGGSVIHPDADVVAILTGNTLKDPDFTVQYHTGQLYTDAERETHLTRAEGKLTATFANTPRRVPADANALRQVILDLLETPPA
ncbi:threonine synthase [Chloracidobacterium aggregatum]|uniref:Threonine synthase n=1 Tax=Chloracidobacterium sp. N TaxID=2821540 RepID=A0ABX8B3J7_9BACT|nr:threonine synthase [Chloracidobacterium aggregatum]QUV85414.1 threonine synthase [Chloracidobacterium sp. 2]QUV88184.1 threonine synthase [Chloracidobacterium sp. S]QUV91105.1 threonine synthase [Chloracidobacterium sp. A]QUV94290.1 threonine synthase [Chloracidobacterium sp. N]QUV97491.1 threonine synthase [Chloracidobacterium sp. E]